MAETLLIELAAVPAYEHCEGGERRRCPFLGVLPDEG